VKHVLPAKLAVLLHLDPVGIAALVFPGRIVASFAVRTGQRYLHPHVMHPQNTKIKGLCPFITFSNLPQYQGRVKLFFPPGRGKPEGKTRQARQGEQPVKVKKSRGSPPQPLYKASCFTWQSR
jgi:hypothetical protein